MKCYVNDEFISVEKISYRIFGLGNEVNDRNVYSYSLILNKNELSNILEQRFNEYILESKKDDELYGSLKDELSELGYPEFSQMLNCYPNVLCNYIKSSFQLELLEGCLNSNNQNDLKYIINSIDYLEIIGEDVIVKGSVFEASK